MLIGKFYSSLLIIGIYCFTTSLAFRESDTRNKIEFYCEDNKGIFSTVANNDNGDLQTLFHWKSEAFNFNTDLSQLCIDTTEKLNEYFSQNNNANSFILRPTTLSQLPLICIVNDNKNCDFLLLVLEPVDKPLQKSYKVLNQIIDNKFRENTINTYRDSNQFDLLIELFN